MLSIAQANAPSTVEIEARTAATGVPLITDSLELAHASDAVQRIAAQLLAPSWNGVIVAAFGDPGIRQLRDRLGIPVTGIAEAAMREASTEGRRFAVVTTTKSLVAAIRKTAEDYGHSKTFLGTVATESDPRILMTQPGRLEAAIHAACATAIDELQADALVIGGGPLALVARSLRIRFTRPIIEPIPAAVRLAISRALALT